MFTRRLVSGLVTSVLLFWLLVPVQNRYQTAVAAPDPGPSPTGIYIVTLKEDAGEPTGVARALERRFGAEVRPERTYRYALNGFSARMSPGLARQVASAPEVANIEADGYAYADAQTLPTGVDRADGDRNTTARIDGFDERVNATVAVLDTGSGPHPELNVVGGVDCTSTGSYNDNNSHGSHVAGTIGAIDNGDGVVGIAPGARIYSVKVLGASASGTWANIICGVDWVTANAASLGITVANMSLSGGGTAGTSCAASALRQAICNSVAAGVTYIVSAGNSGANVANYMPASFPEVITIAALADTDGQPGSLGPNAIRGTAPNEIIECDDCWAKFSNYGTEVDIVAPGLNILSTSLSGGYTTKSGTSMSAPLVTGAAALHVANNGAVGPSALRSALYGTTIATTIPGNPAARTERLLNVGNGFAGPSTPTPTATNTPLPTATSTAEPTATSTNTPLPTATNTPLPTPTNTPLPTATDTPLPTATNTPLPTPTNTPLPTATDTPLPTATNTPLPTATDTPQPTATDTPLPTATNTPLPTATDTPQPTATSTSTPPPTATNTPLPTATNTALPTSTNTPQPTATFAPLPTATSSPLPTATATPTSLTVFKSSRTGNSTTGTVCYDQNLATYWTASSSGRTKSGYIWFDLGSTTHLSQIQWIFAANATPGSTDGLTIEISDDAKNWTYVAAPGSAPNAEWQNMAVNLNARYVRFHFANPNQLAEFAFLAEVNFVP